jgi:hypothetical protein
MWAANAGVVRSSHLSSNATLAPSDSNSASPTPSVTTGVGLSAAPESSASNFCSWAYAALAMANAATSTTRIVVGFIIRSSLRQLMLLVTPVPGLAALLVLHLRRLIS